MTSRETLINKDNPVEDRISLHTMAGGAVEELFGRELDKITADILDLNAEATAVREIVIKIKVKPDENRNFGSVAITVDSKSGSAKAVGSVFSFGRRSNRAVAAEFEPEQKPMFDITGPRPVIDMKTGEIK